MSNSDLVVWRLIGARNQYVLPSTTMPSGPHGLLNAPVLILTVLDTLRHVWVSLFIVPIQTLTSASSFLTYHVPVVQSQHLVCLYLVSLTHRAHDDYRLLVLNHEIEEVGGLLERVGAVRDHDAVDIVLLDELRDAPRELQQVIVGVALGG